jgi:dTDP-glucose pyrophosphorylase/CBS domain-containing protein
LNADLEKICLPASADLRACITSLNRGEKGIVLLLDTRGRLLGTITDGDVRRAILAGTRLEAPVAELLTAKAHSRYARPVTAPLGTGSGELLCLMRTHSVRQVPLVDEEGRVAGLMTMADLIPAQSCTLEAVIMAGGQGSRLRPMTETLPKPMLPVGEKPLMEHIVEQLKEAGIQRVSVATHYLPEKIKEHFGDGSGFGVEFNYVNEDRPLGTAGALGLMEPPKETLLVINGDILTKVDFQAMQDFHREQDALITVAVRKFEMSVPYGVVEGEGGFVTKLEEKPSLGFFVNAGIYLLEPDCFRYLPAGRRMDMTELIQALLAEGERVASFPIHEYWLDIGRHDDYLRAQEDHKSGRLAK